MLVLFGFILEICYCITGFREDWWIPVASHLWTSVTGLAGQTWSRRESHCCSFWRKSLCHLGSFQNAAIWYQSYSHPGRVPAKILSFTMPQPPWCLRTGGWETLRLRSFFILAGIDKLTVLPHRAETRRGQSSGEKLTAVILGPTESALSWKWLVPLVCNLWQ